MNTSDNSIRLAHFSDIHITASRLGWRVRDLLSKRVSGWINLRWLGRGRQFLSTEEVVVALVAELRQARPDRVVFSGDASALGFEAEFVRAAELLGLTDSDVLPGIAVPGNHDYYIHREVRTGSFERHFAPWLTGERIDDAVYPFAQRVGSFWLVGVNSSVPNLFPRDASGHTGKAQLERLEELLRRLPAAPRILVTHYPVCRECGTAEKPHHALRDLDRLVEVAARGGVCLWLHGHRHGAYHHQTSSLAPFPVICAGSATQSGLWSYKQYTIEGRHLRALRRTYDAEARAFRDGPAFELELPC